ncbi:hypothetical protein GCM10007862_12330 [Dyella lipolytica]|uniref:FRG domain-containing protein n=1 Tax=Dyella lipolytica TaxID=1867835 RepID=A0ABW8IUF0_9GAMM|nr:FRG domain-containing protein [Dyella lipolytica]GLQ46182.1 hypothetical protein GCM10007862_12330 [Dyella lipolytica]
MGDFIKTEDCGTLAEFWTRISPVHPSFASPTMVFRGQRVSAWRLIPRVFRKDVRQEFDYGMFAMPDRDHPLQTIFEFTLLASFMQFCDARGLAVPGDSPQFREYLARIMIKYSSHNEAWPDPMILPLMALAQHHGVPTRLLDVSSNPYVAAYFAASSTIEAFSKLRNDQDRADFARGQRLAVFGVDVGTLHNAVGIRQIRVPGSTSPNLSAQAGSFLLVENHGMRGEPFVEDVSIEDKLEALPKLSDELRTPIDATLLTKVTLPVGYAAMLLKWCMRHGITAATIFPGYDGAAKAAIELVMAERFEAAMKPSSFTT